MKTISCLGYSVHPEKNIPESFRAKKMVINTINPHCYCEAKKDNLYSQALHDSDLLLPDGIGYVLAIRVLNGIKTNRFPGFDLHTLLLQKINNRGGKVFYMGSSTLTLEKIEEKIKLEYPNVQVASYSPPFKKNFSTEENNQIINAINEFSPDVLFVGMTAPKQEKWVHRHKDSINAGIIASVGAVFDFYANTVKRPGKFWQSNGLEWLPRLLRQPIRLWRRNFISAPVFIWDVFLTKIGLLKH